MTVHKKADVVGRRSFFARGATAVAGAAVTTIIPTAPVAARPLLALVSYPTIGLGNIRDLEIDQPRVIAYPDAASPGVLLKLGKSVEGGAGPDRDIVAFSTLCPHRGFPLTYRADDKTLNCPGHYSRFDCEMDGLQIFGHATQNLPRFRLHIDQSGDIFADSIDDLLYGRLSNVLQG